MSFEFSYELLLKGNHLLSVLRVTLYFGSHVRPVRLQMYVRFRYGMSFLSIVSSKMSNKSRKVHSSCSQIDFLSLFSNVRLRPIRAILMWMSDLRYTALAANDLYRVRVSDFRVRVGLGLVV